MNLTQKNLLVNALERVFSFQDQTVRSSIFDNLPKLIQNGWRRNNSLRVDIINLLTACLGQENGMNELFETLRFLEEDSIFLREAEKVWKRIVAQSEIHSLISQHGIERKHVIESYRMVLPDGSKVEGVDSLDNILTDLNILSPGVDNIHPLVKFIESLATLITDSETASALHEWSSTYAHTIYDSNLEKLQNYRRKLVYSDDNCEDKQDAFAYLMVELHPQRGLSKKIYKFDVIFWDKTGKRRIIKYHDQDDEAVSIDEFPDKLANTLKGQRIPDDFILEFLLPDELLDHEIEYLEDRRHKNVRDIKYGLQYPVTIRIQERAKAQVESPDFRELCLMKWKRYKSVLKNQTSAHTIWVFGDKDTTWRQLESDRKQILDKNLFYEIKLRKEVVCLGFTFLPLPSAHAEEIFHVILDSAIPIILWYRTIKNDCSAYDKILLDIHQASSLGPLFKLPYSIRSYRYEAYESDNLEHVGHKVSLLWDDPTRLPPHYDLDNDRAYEPE